MTIDMYSEKEWKITKNQPNGKQEFPYNFELFQVPNDHRGNH